MTWYAFVVKPVTFPSLCNFPGIEMEKWQTKCLCRWRKMATREWAFSSVCNCYVSMIQMGGSRQIIGMVVKIAESEEAGMEWAKEREELNEVAAPRWRRLHPGEEGVLPVQFTSHRLWCRGLLMATHVCRVCRHQVEDIMRLIAMHATFREDSCNKKLKKRCDECKVVLRVLGKVENLGKVSFKQMSRPRGRQLGSHG